MYRKTVERFFSINKEKGLCMSFKSVSGQKPENHILCVSLLATEEIYHTQAARGKE